MQDIADDEDVLDKTGRNIVQIIAITNISELWSLIQDFGVLDDKRIISERI